MRLKSKYLKRLYNKYRHSWQGIILINFIKYVLSRDWFKVKLKIHNRGSLRIKKWVLGKDNTMIVGKNSCLNNVILRIQGSHNLIEIENNVILGKNCKIYLFGNHLKLKIGEGTTFTHDDELLVQEDKSMITIGKDCQFSHHINVRTSDAHPIYYSNTNERANKAKDVVIGNHVWVGANVIIQKGAQIGDGCVVGTYSIVNHRILDRNSEREDAVPHDAILAGIPAKIVKSGIYWERSFNDK